MRILKLRQIKWLDQDNFTNKYLRSDQIYEEFSDIDKQLNTSLHQIQIMWLCDHIIVHRMTLKRTQNTLEGVMENVEELHLWFDGFFLDIYGQILANIQNHEDYINLDKINWDFLNCFSVSTLMFLFPCTVNFSYFLLF